MQIIRKLWRDKRAAILSTELVLLASLVVVGVVAAVGNVRTALHNELSDIARVVNRIQPEDFQRREIAGERTNIGPSCIVVEQSFAEDDRE